MSYTEYKRLEYRKIQQNIQHVLALDHEQFCWLQFEFYLAYPEAMIPSITEAGREIREQLLYSEVFRMWFLKTWADKDREFLNQLHVSKKEPFYVYRTFQQVDDSLSIEQNISTISGLRYYYLQHHKKVGLYENVPEIVLERVFKQYQRV